MQAFIVARDTDYAVYLWEGSQPDRMLGVYISHKNAQIARDAVNLTLRLTGLYKKVGE